VVSKNYITMKAITRFVIAFIFLKTVGPPGLEPGTPWLWVRCYILIKTAQTLVIVDK